MRRAWSSCGEHACFVPMMLDECSAAVSWLQLPCDDFDQQFAALLGCPVASIDSVAKLHRFKQDANHRSHQAAFVPAWDRTHQTSLSRGDQQQLDISL